MYENTKNKGRATVRNSDVVYPELSYRIVGVLLEVQKQIGSGYKEKHYQKCVAKELTYANLEFKEQLPVPLFYKGEKIGLYFMDFLITGDKDERVVLEIKRNAFFSNKHIEQVDNYLKSSGLQLGILANFTSTGLKYKRIVNIKN